MAAAYAYVDSEEVVEQYSNSINEPQTPTRVQHRAGNFPRAGTANDSRQSTWTPLTEEDREPEETTLS